MYNKRAWLNGENSDATSSVVAFDGEVTDQDTQKKYPHMFLEIADCHRKVRIHLTSDDTRKDFLNKIKRLEAEILKFIMYLEENEPPKTEQP